MSVKTTPINYIITFVIMFFTMSSAFSQKTIEYQLPWGVLNQNIYDGFKKMKEKQGMVFRITDSVVKDDKITYIVDVDRKNYVKPIEKLIGTKFNIDDFYQPNGKAFPADYLEGKPTLINFWFIACEPCVAEFPYLNKLKEIFGDKANFLAITFDEKNAVHDFLKTKEFNYLQITDSRQQIDDINISSYPTSLLLDKSGRVQKVIKNVGDYNIEGIKALIKTML